MAVERISPEEWQRIAPALRTCSQVTIDMAYAVLVDGRKQVDVAKEFDRSKQRSMLQSGALLRFLTKLSRKMSS